MGRLELFRPQALEDESVNRAADPVFLNRRNRLANYLLKSPILCAAADECFVRAALVARLQVLYYDQRLRLDEQIGWRRFAGKCPSGSRSECKP